MAPKRQSKVEYIKTTKVRSGDLVRLEKDISGNKTNWLVVVEIKEIGNELEFTCGTGQHKRVLILKKNGKILTQKQLPAWQQ